MAISVGPLNIKYVWGWKTKYFALSKKQTEGYVNTLIIAIIATSKSL